MQRAESHELLNRGQYGSRALRTAHEPLYFEILQRQITTSTRFSLLQTNFDAKSCYDRIIPALAGLTSQAFGLPPNVTLCNTKTLEQAQYHLKLGDKYHPNYYSHNPEHPIYGTGQGSGNSPFIWCLISSLLFDCFKSDCLGASYCTPDHSTYLKIGMIGFVDDTNGQINDFLEPKPLLHTTIIQRAEQDVVLWKSLLEATGGALEPPKCSFHLIRWTFRPDFTPVISNKAENAQSFVTSQPTLSEFKHLKVDEAHKTLGTYQTPNSNQRTQLIQLLDKATKFRDTIIKYPMSRKEAITFYHSIYIPSITYPLATTFFSEKTLTKLQRKVDYPLTTKFGLNRNTAKAILYGPPSLGGFGLLEFYSIQGSYQLLTIIKYWRRQCDLGTLFRITLSWVQYSLGIKSFFLHDVTTPLPHFEGDWLISLRQFLCNTQCSLVLSKPITQQPNRENDDYIMDLILKSNQFNPKQIRRINYCRLFLNVLLLSDITEPDGSTLTQLTTIQNQSALHPWPLRKPIHQNKPSSLSWKLWHRASAIWSTSNNKLRNSRSFDKTRPKPLLHLSRLYIP